MPALVNHGRDDEFGFPGAMYNYMDSSLILSLGSCVDVYCAPRKRSRISAPYVIRSEARVEEQKRSSVDALPDECLFEIFRRLPAGEDRRACACVSRRWLSLQSSLRQAEICSSPQSEPELESDAFLTRCLEAKAATDTRLAAIAVGTATNCGLSKLTIRGSNSTRGVTDRGLTAISRGCPSLKVLSLWDVASVTDQGLMEIANGCHGLEKIDLCRCPLISDAGLAAIARNCPSLTSLTIESCAKVANEGLQAIGRCCPNLRSISIIDCPLVDDNGVAGLVSATSTVLTKLKLQGVNVTDLSVALIGHYGMSVADISLTGLQGVSERGFWVMGKGIGLQKLKRLSITACRGVTDLGLEAFGKGCPNLKLLHLCRCSFVSDNGLKGFTTAAPSLESLQLEECNRITQLGVLAALSNCGDNLKALALVKCVGIKDTTAGFAPLNPCKSLRSLKICSCPGFGSAGLAVVGKLCPQLQQIYFTGLGSVTDPGLLALVESNDAGLEEVDLSGCSNLTDAAIVPLVRMHGGTLQTLNLDGCKWVSDQSLVAIAEHCSLLVDLDLSSCMVTDAGVAALASAKQLDLQILSLSGCSKVSGRSVSALRDLGDSLVGLNLQLCKSISSKAVSVLEQQLFRCDILF